MVQNTGSISSLNLKMDGINQRVRNNVANSEISYYHAIGSTSKHVSKETRYVFPCDGYLNVFDGDSGNLAVVLTDKNGILIGILTSGRVAGQNLNSTCFVKKGMGCFVFPQTNKISTPTAYNGFNFYPLSD